PVVILHQMYENAPEITIELDGKIGIGKINLELQSGTHKLIKKLSQEKVSQEEAIEQFKSMVERDDEIKFNSTLDNVLEKLSQEKDSPDDFYGFMYDTDDDASISGKSCEHFGWDWPEKDSPGTEVDWQDDPLHETEDFFVGLDQSIQVMVVQNNVQHEVAREVVFYPLVHEEVAKECLDDKQVEEKRPSKRIRVTQKEMVKDEKPKKG
ncbi:hypothetical protein Tco_0597596, partial [Tanacetum coccineum]